jgi:hypothetical protein
MKPITFILYCLLICITACNSGAKTPAMVEEAVLHPKFAENKLHGIGVFKIGSSVEATIDELVNNEKYVLDTIGNVVDQRDSRKLDRLVQTMIFRIKPTASTLEADVNMIKQSYTIALWCRQTTTFTIAKYVVDSIVLNDLVLRYYNNKLVYMECKATDELISAIQSKYGKYDMVGDVDSWHGYKNGDVEAWFMGDYDAALPKQVLKIYVTGARNFMEDCGKRDFAAQDSIDKGNKHQGLKNL